MYNCTVGSYIIICIVKSDMYIIGKIIVDSVIEKVFGGILMNKKMSAIVAVIIVLMMSFCTINVMAVENTNEKKVSTIEIKCDSFTKNDSTEKSIECGSGSTFSATVKYSDGTTATGDDAKVQWKITGSDSNNNVYTKVNDDENSIYVYAPYHYADKLNLTATSVTNNTVSGTYDVEVFDEHSTGPSNFFIFNSSDDEELDVTGDEPTFEEKWNNETCEYSVTAPKNSYELDGYTFLYWKDDDGNKYNVGDTITVKTTGSPSICNLYGVWKSDTTDETTESADNNTSTADESSGSDMTSPKTGNNDGLLIVMFSLCLVAICGVCVYKIKK